MINKEHNDELILGHTVNGCNNMMDAENVDDIINILDSYVSSGGSRMKLNVIEGDGNIISKQYHHGRCDIGSPWAKGQAFDVLENEE